MLSHRISPWTMDAKLVFSEIIPDEVAFQRIITSRKIKGKVRFHDLSRNLLQTIPKLGCLQDVLVWIPRESKNCENPFCNEFIKWQTSDVSAKWFKPLKYPQSGPSFIRICPWCLVYWENKDLYFRKCLKLPQLCRTTYLPTPPPSLSILISTRHPPQFLTPFRRAVARTLNQT